MKTSVQNNPSFEKVKEMIQELEIAMLTTTDETENLVSRPMAVLEVDADGNIYFFTSNDSPKTTQIDRDFRVNLSFSNVEKQKYLSIAGAGRIIDDRSKIKELWTHETSLWFPEGENDPNLQILKVETHRVQYWDSSESKMVQLLDMDENLLDKLANENPEPRTTEQLPASEQVHLNPINLSVPYRID